MLCHQQLEKMAPSGHGLVTLNTNELTTVTAAFLVQKTSNHEFPKPAQSNPFLPYPAISVAHEKQLTAGRMKSPLETRLMCYI